MCRIEQLRGMLMLGIGVGLLAGCWFSSGFWQVCFGICLMGAGLLGLIKK